MEFLRDGLKAGGLILLAIGGFGCVSQDPEERLDRMGPVFGRNEVRYMMSAGEGGFDLDSAADVARTIGRYRRLNFDEAETVRRLAQEKFDGFVLREIRNLEPAFEARKRRIRKEFRNLAATAGPDQAARIREDEAEAIDRIDDEIRERAVIAVRRRYGSQIAVPLRTPDSKPAVAIAKIRGDRVEAPDSAIELDGEPGSAVEHEGKRTAVIGAQVDLGP